MGAMKAVLDITLSVSKHLKPVVATAWRYAKVEMIPPMTSHIFQGPLGKRLENAASGAADNFIAGIDQQLKAIEAEKLRVIKEKEAVRKAAADTVKALKKAAEEKRVEAEKAAAAAKAKKAKEEAAKNAEESPKTATKAKVKSKDNTRRVAPKTKKKPKKRRRVVKKGSAPKPKK